MHACILSTGYLCAFLPTYVPSYILNYIHTYTHAYIFIYMYIYIYIYVHTMYIHMYVRTWLHKSIYIYNVNAFVNSADLYIFKHKSCIWTHYCRTISSRILLVRNQAPVKKHLFGILHIFGSLQIWFSIGWTLRSAKHHRSPSPNEKIADEQCSSLKVGQPKKGK